MTIYVDISAAMKLVAEEAESAAMARWLRDTRELDTVVASLLLHTELHCAATRRAHDIPSGNVEAVLTSINLIDLDRSDLLAAPALPGRLRSADAIHLATAVRVGADTIVSYDEKLNAAAEAAGLTVLSPQ